MAGISSLVPHEHVHTVQFYGDCGVLLHELKITSNGIGANPNHSPGSP